MLLLKLQSEHLHVHLNQHHSGCLFLQNNLKQVFPAPNLKTLWLVYKRSTWPNILASWSGTTNHFNSHPLNNSKCSPSTTRLHLFYCLLCIGLLRVIAESICSLLEVITLHISETTPQPLIPFYSALFSERLYLLLRALPFPHVLSLQSNKMEWHMVDHPVMVTMRKVAGDSDVDSNALHLFLLSILFLFSLVNCCLQSISLLTFSVCASIFHTQNRRFYEFISALLPVYIYYICDISFVSTVLIMVIPMKESPSRNVLISLR